MRYLVLAFLLLPFSSTTLWGEEFEVIGAIPGVSDVRYEDPFLFVISESLVDVPRIRIAVGKIESEGRDPDLVALQGRYNLRVYNSASYKVHLEDQSLALRADSLWEMKELFRRSRFATVVSLDWNSEEPVESRKRYTVKNVPADEDSFLDHDRQIDAVVSRIEKAGKKPEALIFIEYYSVGRLVYPVFDGKIHANGKKVSYRDFTSALPEPL